MSKPFMQTEISFVRDILTRIQIADADMCKENYIQAIRGLVYAEVGLQERLRELEALAQNRE